MHKPSTGMTQVCPTEMRLKQLNAALCFIPPSATEFLYKAFHIARTATVCMIPT